MTPSRQLTKRRNYRGNPFSPTFPLFASQCGTFSSMNSVIAAPVDWIESVGNLRLPSKADHHLRELMDRKQRGTFERRRAGRIGGVGGVERAVVPRAG